MRWRPPSTHTPTSNLSVYCRSTVCPLVLLWLRQCLYSFQGRGDSRLTCLFLRPCRRVLSIKKKRRPNKFLKTTGNKNEPMLEGPLYRCSTGHQLTMNDERLLSFLHDDLPQQPAARHHASRPETPKRWLDSGLCFSSDEKTCRGRLPLCSTIYKRLKVGGKNHQSTKITKKTTR